MKRFTLRRIIPVIIASATVITLSGCQNGQTSKDNIEITESIARLEEENKELRALLEQLEKESNVREQNKDSQIAELEDQIASLKVENEILEETNRNLEKASENNAENFESSAEKPENSAEDKSITDTPKIDLVTKHGTITVDSIGKSFCFRLPIEGRNGVAKCYEFPTRVVEIVRDGKKYLVNNDDYTDVLISDYDEIVLKDWWLFTKTFNCGEYVPFKNKYGTYEASTFIEVRRGDKYSYYLASNPSECILYNIDKQLWLVDDRNMKAIKPFDIPSADGQDFKVLIIPKDGINYLVDAADFNEVLAVDVANVNIDYNEKAIEITHSDGNIERFKYSDLNPQNDDILLK